MIPSPGETWEHYKGNCYLVKDITRDSETLRLRVSYTDGDVVWSRVLTGISPVTGQPCGWNDPLPDGRPRYVRVS
jgi:hypothetical protein